MNEELLKKLRKETQEWFIHKLETEGVDENFGWREEAKMRSEKLVSLVVDECVDQIKKVCERHSDQYIDAALRDTAFEIHQHFGVKND